MRVRRKQSSGCGDGVLCLETAGGPGVGNCRSPPHDQANGMCMGSWIHRAVHAAVSADYVVHNVLLVISILDTICSTRSCTSLGALIRSIKGRNLNFIIKPIGEKVAQMKDSRFIYRSCSFNPTPLHARSKNILALFFIFSERERHSGTVAGSGCHAVHGRMHRCLCTASLLISLTTCIPQRAGKAAVWRTMYIPYTHI